MIFLFIIDGEIREQNQQIEQMAGSVREIDQEIVQSTTSMSHISDTTSEVRRRRV